MLRGRESERQKELSSIIFHCWAKDKQKIALIKTLGLVLKQAALNEEHKRSCAIITTCLGD